MCKWIAKWNRAGYNIHFSVAELGVELGPKRAKAAGPGASKYNDIHRIVSNLGVFDVKGADDTVRLLSLHPGVTLEEVVENTGFTLEIPADVATTREPTEAELMLIRNVLDPKNFRDREVPPVTSEAAK